jgi:hypothetical protein
MQALPCELYWYSKVDSKIKQEYDPIFLLKDSTSAQVESLIDVSNQGRSIKIAKMNENQRLGCAKSS